MKSVSILLTFLLLGIVVSPAGADVYSWVDAAGVRHFSNTPPPDTTPGVTAIQEQIHDAVADGNRTAIDRETLDRINTERKETAPDTQGGKGLTESEDPAGQIEAQKTKADPSPSDLAASKKKTAAQRQRARIAAQGQQGQ
ncbi:MAG: DUF4124 domain-containing protein [Desulfobacterales bacterium]|nr:DUF4124 domain-containing protein [Desulfobacterales bacterium]